MRQRESRKLPTRLLGLSYKLTFGVSTNLFAQQRKTIVICNPEYKATYVMQMPAKYNALYKKLTNYYNGKPHS